MKHILVALLICSLLPSTVILALDNEKASTGANSERVAALINVFRDPEIQSSKSSLRSATIRELTRIGKPAVAQLIDAVVSDESKTRTVGAYSLLTLEYIGKNAVTGVRGRWDKLTETQKWRLMRFRGKHDYKLSRDFVLTSLRSKDKAVRKQAIEYVGKHKEVLARKILLERLSIDDAFLRWAIAHTLAEVGGEAVIDAFIPLLSPDSWAARGEGVTPPPGVPPYWWPEGRGRIIYLLGKLKAQRAGPAIIRVLQEKGKGKPYLSQFIAPALAELPYPEAIPALKEALASEGVGGFRLNTPVGDRKAAMAKEKARVDIIIALGLFKLGDRTGRSVLAKIVQGPKRWEQSSAVEAIARYGNKDDIPLLVEAWGLGHSNIRVLASWGLCRLTGEGPQEKEPTASVQNNAPNWREWWKKHKNE